MRFVERADARPNLCVVLPHLGASHHKGYIDPGNDLTCIDPHPYVSVQAVEEMNKVLGWPTQQQHADAIAELERALARVDDLEAQLAEADRFAESVKWTLGRFGEEVRNKPGRPKKKESEAA